MVCALIIAHTFRIGRRTGNRSAVHVPDDTAGKCPFSMIRIGFALARCLDRTGITAICYRNASLCVADDTTHNANALNEAIVFAIRKRIVLSGVANYTARLASRIGNFPEIGGIGNRAVLLTGN